MWIMSSDFGGQAFSLSLPTLKKVLDIKKPFISSHVRMAPSVTAPHTHTPWNPGQISVVFEIYIYLLASGQGTSQNFAVSVSQTCITPEANVRSNKRKINRNSQEHYTAFLACLVYPTEAWVEFVILLSQIFLSPPHYPLVLRILQILRFSEHIHNQENQHNSLDRFIHNSKSRLF